MKMGAAASLVEVTEEDKKDQEDEVNEIPEIVIKKLPEVSVTAVLSRHTLQLPRNDVLNEIST